jgi:hypothetical protein
MVGLIFHFCLFYKKTADPFLTVGVLGGQNQIPTFGFILLYFNQVIIFGIGKL